MTAVPPYACCGAYTKKADVVEHPEVFDHVGLLATGPAGDAGLPVI
jgi:hypothetical protein